MLFRYVGRSKRTVVVIALLLIIATYFNTSIAQADCPNTSVVQNFVSKIYPGFSVISVKQDYFINDLCDVVIQRNTVALNLFISKDASYLLSGVVTNQNRAVLINYKANPKFIHIDNDVLSKLSQFTAVNYNPTASRTMYVIIDIGTPHLHETMQAVKDWADKANVNLKIILFYLKGYGGKPLYKESFYPAANILCANESKRLKLLDVYLRMPKSVILSSKDVCEDGIKEIKEVTDYLNGLQIYTSPVFISDKGNFSSGLICNYAIHTCDTPLLFSLMNYNYSGAKK